MRRPQTAVIFVFLILLSWAIELGGGLILLHIVWGSPWFLHSSLAAAAARSLNNAFQVDIYLFRRIKHANPGLTASSILDGLTWIYVGLHGINAIWFGFLVPSLTLRKSGARKLSGRERLAFDKAVAQISSASGEPISAPRTIRTADGSGLQMRWIGYVLVIDRKLFSHRFFASLLAHELGHSNSEDRLAHRLYAMLPRPAAIVGTLGGFPFALGHILLYPAWMWYWRERIYAADAFAVRAGQGFLLEQALDRLYLQMDRATRWGRWWKPVPYVEQRIDRLCKFRQP